jgi:hypothetical protein
VDAVQETACKCIVCPCLEVGWSREGDKYSAVVQENVVLVMSKEVCGICKRCVSGS